MDIKCKLPKFVTHKTTNNITNMINTAELASKPNLAKAIIAVMKDIKGVEKGLTVGTGGSSYKGVGDKDVKIVIGRAMAEHGLCILPIHYEPNMRIDRWEEADPYKKDVMKVKQQVFTEITAKYLLLHESGESIEVVGYGHGIDSQDKSAGKASTYSLKYALLYCFLVPTGDIDDGDAVHSNDIPVPNTKVKTATVKAPTVKPTAKITLEKDTPNWVKVVKAIKDKVATVADIETKYSLSAELKTELTNLIR